MLGSGRPQVIAARFFGESQVYNRVWATFLCEAHAAIRYLEDTDHVIIALVSSSNILTIWRDSACCNGSRVFWKLESSFLLGCLGIPHKTRGGFTDLSGDSPLSVSSSVDIHAHDVVIVMRLVTSNLLGRVFDFTTSEKGLSVRWLIEDHTKACGHIADITVWVVVYVLT
jgi:hypothetical protein